MAYMWVGLQMMPIVRGRVPPGEDRQEGEQSWRKPHNYQHYTDAPMGHD